MADISRNAANKVTLDTAEAVQSIKSLKSEISSSTAEWKAQSAALKSAGDDINAAKSKYDGLSSVVDKQKGVVSALKSEMAVEAQQTSKNSAEYQKLETQYNNANTKLVTLTNQQDKAKQSMELQTSGISAVNKAIKENEESTRVQTERLKAEGNEEAANARQKEELAEKIRLTNDLYQKQETRLKELTTAENQDEDAIRKQALALDKTGTSLAKTHTAMGEVGKSAQKVTESTEEATKSSRWSRFSSSIENSNSKLDSTHSKLLGLIGADIVARGAINAITSVKNGITGIISAGVEYDKQLQNIKIGFDNFTNNNDELSKKLLDNFKSVKEESGYAADTVALLTKKTYGLTQNTDDAKNLSDAFVNLGRATGMSDDKMTGLITKFSQANASGEITTGSITKLNKQLPGFSDALAKNLDVSKDKLSELASSGKLSMQDLAKAIETMSNAKPQGLDNYYKTFDGFTTHFEDRYKSLSGKITESFFSSSNQMLAGLSKSLDGADVDKSFNRIGDAANKSVNTIINAFSSTFKGMKTNPVADMANFTADSIEKLGNFVASNSDNITNFFKITKDLGAAGFSEMATVLKITLPLLEEVGTFAKEHPKEFQMLATSIIGVDLAFKGVVSTVKLTNSLMGTFETISSGIKWGAKVLGIDSETAALKAQNAVLAENNALTTAGIGSSTTKSVASVATGKATTGAKESVSETATVGSSSLTSALSKALPYVGVLAGLAQAGTSVYSGTQTKNQTEQRGDYTAAAGSVGGTALGAAIGSTVAPGIGTAIGAALGGTFGNTIGKKLGTDLQNGFKESHPKSLAAWIGEDWDAKYKTESSSTMKKFSSDYNSQVSKLNSNLSLKLSVDTKDNEKNKQKVEGIYKDLQKVIDNFYKSQNNSAKKNLDVLVANGVMSQKEEDKLLKNIESNNKKKGESQKKVVEDMKTTTTKYYDDASKIDSGGTKKLEEIAKKSGTNSKAYKAEQTKELEKLHKKYVDTIGQDETKLNDKVSKASQVAATKQTDLLSDLNNKKKKLNLADILQTESTAEKNHKTIVNNAQDIRDKAVNAANTKFKGVTAAADKEYYQNHDISKKQYNAIYESAKKTRNDTIDIAESAKTARTKVADKEYGKIVEVAEKQRKEVTSKSALQKDDVIANAQKQKDGTTKLGNEQKSALVQAMEDQKKGVTGHSSKQKDTTTEHAQKQKDSTTSLGNQQKNEITGAASSQSQGVIGHATAQANGTMEAASKQAKGTTSIWSSIGSFFNGLVKGFGVKPVDVKGGDYSYRPVGISAFSTGTSGARGGQALVGEAGVEARYSPYSGKVDFVGHNGAQVVDLKPGDQILNAKDTAKLFKGGLGKTLPGYANGTSDLSSFISSVTKGASNIWDDVSDATSDALSKLTDPIKTLTDMASKTFDVNSIAEVGDTGHSSSKGMVDASVKGIGEFLKKLVSSNNSSSGDGGSSEGSPSGSGVTRWTSQVKDALKANGLSTSTAMVDKVLRQIQTESGGNEKAVQGNIGDVNNASGDLAKGLMQVITSTFNANKFSGHNDPFNGYDSLLAGLNYAKKTYGNDLSFLGQGHGYANGGIATSPSIFGEDGPEIAIPLSASKGARAKDLLKVATQHVGDTSSSSNSDALLAQNNQLLNVLSGLVSSILGETQKGNEPLSETSLGNLSKSVINRAVRSAN